MAISSINFQKSKSISVEETNRIFEAKYLLPKKHRKKNEYWNCANIEKYEDLKKLDEDIFKNELANAKRKGGRIPKLENSLWEAVVNLNENHTIEDLKKVAEFIEKKFNIKASRIALHKDEGHYNLLKNQVEYNYHAHLNFVTFKDGKQNWRLTFVNKDRLSELQTKVAEILNMPRGLLNSPNIRANHRDYRNNVLDIKVQRSAIKNHTKIIKKANKIIENEKNEKIKLKINLENSRKEIKKLIKDVYHPTHLTTDNTPEKYSVIIEKIDNMILEVKKEFNIEEENLKNIIEFFKSNFRDFKMQISDLKEQLSKLNEEICKYQTSSVKYEDLDTNYNKTIYENMEYKEKVKKLEKDRDHYKRIAEEKDSKESRIIHKVGNIEEEKNHISTENQVFPTNDRII